MTTTNPTAQALNAFLQQNSSFDIHSFDRSSLDELSWEGVDRAEVTRALEQASRLRHAVSDPVTAYLVAQAGYASLRQMARRATAGFVKDVAGVLDEATARAIQARARGAHARLVQQWMRLRESLGPQPLAHVHPRTARAATSLSATTPANYTTLFGQAPVRETPEAMSIFGAGAYFYDLMDLVEDEITSENDTTIPSALKLRARRPDLWNLPLSMNNVDNLVSQADLTREILESTLLQLAPDISLLNETDASRLPDKPSNIRYCDTYERLQAELVTSPAPDGTLIVVTKSITISAPLNIKTSVTVKAGAPGIVFTCSNGATAFNIDAAKVSIEDVSFSGCGITPAIVVTSGALVLSNTLFVSKASPGAGWAVSCATGEVNIKNATFVDTTASYSSAPNAMFAATDASKSTTFTLLNSILWVNAALAQSTKVKLFNLDPTTTTNNHAVVNLAYCDVVGGNPGDQRIFYDNSNFTAAPKFDPTNYLHLESDSPCVGRGARGVNVGAAKYDIYALLARAIYPFDVPFDLNVQAAVMAFDELDLTLPELFDAGEPFWDRSKYASLAMLGMGLGDLDVLSKPIANANDLAPYYGLASPTTDTDPPAFAEGNVVVVAEDAGAYTFRPIDFARWTGLTLEGLRDLVYQNLSSSEIAAGVQRGKVAWAEIPDKPWKGFYVNADQATALSLQTVFAPVGRYYPRFHPNIPPNTDAAEGTFPFEPRAGSSFTISLWVYIFRAGEVLRLIGKSPGPALTWEIDDAGCLTVSYRNTSATKPVAKTPLVEVTDPALLGQWVHLSTTYNKATSGEIIVYANGQPIGAAKDENNYIHRSSWKQIYVCPLQLTESTNNNTAMVSAADLAAWTAALSPETLARDFQRPPMDKPAAMKTDRPQNLIGYWPLCDNGRSGNQCIANWGDPNGALSENKGSVTESTPWGSAYLPEFRNDVKAEEFCTLDGLSFVQVEVLTGQTDAGRTGLQEGNLDRINRFVRLARRLDWSFADLDWALYTLSITDFTTLGDFDRLAKLRQLQNETGLGLAELCTLFGYLKPFGRGRDGNAAPIFDAVYNRPPLAGLYFTPVMSHVVFSPLPVKVFQQDFNTTSGTLEITEKGYKILGGGALCKANSRTRLCDSYPESLTKWTVQLRQDYHSDTDGFTAYVIALYDPHDQWEVHIFAKQADSTNVDKKMKMKTATATASPDEGQGWFMTGGGASNGGTSVDLQASYPSSSTVWTARSRRDDISWQITSYAIGLRRKGEGEGKLFKHTTSDKVRKGGVSSSASALVTPGLTYAGGGGTIQNEDVRWPEVTNGWLVGSYPDDDKWRVTGSSSTPASQWTMTSYAIGIAIVERDPAISRRVASSLGFSMAEFERVMAAFDRSPRAPSPLGYDWGTLSTLYRFRALAALFRLDVDSLLELVTFAEVDVFNPSFAQDDMLKLVKTFRIAQFAKISPANLNYLSTDPAKIAPPGDPYQASIEQRFRNHLGKLRADFQNDVASVRVTTLSFVSEGVTPEESKGFFAACKTKEYITGDGLCRAKLFDDISKGAVSVDGMDATSLEVLLSVASEQIEVLRKTLATFFDASDLPIISILNYLAPVRNGIEILGENSANDDAVTYLRHVSLYLLLAYEVELKDDEIALLLADPTTFGLPPKVGDLWIPTRSDLQTLARYLLLKEQYPGNVEDILTYLRQAKASPPDTKTAAQALSALFGWDPAQTATLLEALKDKTDALPAMLNVSRVIGLSMRTGFGIDLLRTLNQNAFIFGGDGAMPLLQAIQGIDGEAAQQLGFRLAETKRAILQIFAKPAIDKTTRDCGVRVLTQNDLSNYLLTDVAMGAVTDTSRVVQGTLTLQNYVQRVRLGLEKGADTCAISDKRWGWMDSYRTWEANRRVYLYPENYLRPELRKDKTPLFAEFMDAVDGAAITKEQVKHLYKTYLDGFATLATMRTVGAYYTEDGLGELDAAPGEKIGLYHFIGRSATQPYGYYHRTYEVHIEDTVVNKGQRTGAKWAAWKRIDQDILSDYATPVVFRGQLYVFWAETVLIPEDPNANKKAFYRVKLRYSVQRTNGTWGPVQSPFPIINLNAGIDPTSDPLWRRVYVVPTTYENQAALFVQYGPMPTGPLSLFVLRQDQTVVDGLTFSSSMFSFSKTPEYSALVVAQNPAKLLVNWNVPFYTTMNASPAVYTADDYIAVVDAPAVVPSASAPLAYRITTSNLHGSPAQSITVAMKVGAMPIVGSDGVQPSITYHAGNYYFVCDKTGKLYKSAKPWESEAWVEVNGTGFVASTLPAGAVSASAPQLASAHEYLYAVYRYTSSSSCYLQLIRSRDGESWTTVWPSSPTKVSAVNPSLSAIGDTLYGVYVEANTNRKMKYFTKSGFDAPVGIGDLCTTTYDVYDVSQIVNWQGMWYCAYSHQASSKRNVRLLHASLVAGPWADDAMTKATWGDGYYSTTARCGVGLVMTSDALVVSYGLRKSTGNYMKSQVYTATGSVLTQPWTAAFGTPPNSDTTATPYTPMAAISRNFAGVSKTLLDTPGDDVAVIPVGNQLSAFIAHTDGGDFLVEAIDTSGRPENVGVTATITGNTVTLAGVRTTNFSNDTFQFQRLDSTAVLALVETLSQGGIDALMAPKTQGTDEYDFSKLGPKLTTDNPAGSVLAPPDTKISFRLEDAFGQYYREVFFFIPWLLSDKLRENLRYKEARTWLDYIVCPTDPQGAWRSVWLDNLPDLNVDPTTTNAALLSYHEDPFNANAIADLRPHAYRKAIFMAYVQNLIDWGDTYFGLNTRETLNEAAQIYRFAQDLLGPKPKLMPYTAPTPETYAELEAEQTNAGNEFLIEMAPANPVPGTNYDPNNNIVARGVYFGVPDNDRLTLTWDVVDDRLFKIRNGLDLTGAPNPLPLFAPEVDPMDLVRGAGEGGEASASVSVEGGEDTKKEMARIALEAAKGMVQTLMEFGRSLQSALEQKDAETLAALQAGQETVIAEQMRRIREQEVNEARANLDSLRSARSAAQHTKTHFEVLQKKGLSRLEMGALGLSAASIKFRTDAVVANAISAPLFLLPNIFGVATGGMDWGESAAAVATAADSAATALTEVAGLLTTRAEQERRAEDWKYQAALATYDIERIDAEMRAAEMRIRASEMQYALEETTWKQRQEIEKYYQSKFTNAELYQWLAETLAELYHQLYQIAESVARTAQKRVNAYTQGQNTFITPGAWDAKHRGLLAGERLFVDLARMEQEFLKYEDSQNSSNMGQPQRLSEIDPEAFLELQRKGTCEFDLSEADFARLHPSLYGRRIVDVSLEFLGLEGEAVHGELVQLSGSVALRPDIETARFLLLREGAPGRALGRRLRPVHAAFSAESGKTTALGAFSRAPVVGRYRLSLAEGGQRLDLSALRDVVLHLRYEAHDGGESFRNAVQLMLPPLRVRRVLNMAKTNPESWSRLVGGAAQCDVSVDRKTFGKNLRGQEWTASRLGLYVTFTPQEDGTDEAVRIGFGSWLKARNVVIPASGGTLLMEEHVSIGLDEFCQKASVFRLGKSDVVRRALAAVHLVVEVEEV